LAIFVETVIRGASEHALDEVWHRSQTPELHERWDLRFTRIRYLPKSAPEDPQRFLYETRVGFGLRISGEGESTGVRGGASGERSSALTFWSEDSKSLIEKGSGYWKYVPCEGGVLFQTRYDYRVRFGALGRAVDRALFRPLLAWATAWSFDRLRLWVEQGVPPESTRDAALSHAVLKGTLGFVWIYQGLVPKLLGPHADELRMLANAGVAAAWRPATARGLGALEIALGLAMLLLPRSAAPIALTIVLMGLALAGVAATSPAFLGAAFNPVSLNVAVLAVAIGALLAARWAPFAGRTRWSSRA
jgi:hypothetical protein